MSLNGLRHRLRTGCRLAVCRLVVAVAGLVPLTGCTWMTQFGSSDLGLERSKTFFVGGAGAIGALAGTFEVPAGLRKAGYDGAIEVFGWQAYLGDALRDQVDRERNLVEARRLSDRIEEYRREHPGRPVYIIALSAGTGIATWALESLPARPQVERVVFLSSSLSNLYDLGPALIRVRSGLYNFYSDDDPVLGVLMQGVGTVDRSTLIGPAAGLRGVATPPTASPQTAALYEALVRNQPYRKEYARFGYNGLHADSISEPFITAVVAPVLLTGQHPPIDATAPDTEREEDQRWIERERIVAPRSNLDVRIER